MKTYFLISRGSDGFKSVLFECSDVNEILFRFVHALDFDRVLGYKIHKVVLNGLDSYYIYGNKYSTTKVFIL